VAGRFEPGVQGFSFDGLCAYRQGSNCCVHGRALRLCGVLFGFAAGSDLSGVDRQFEFVAGLFGCGVDPDLVEELGGQFLFAAAHSALTSPVDQRHQRPDVAGGPRVEVVAEVLGDHAGVRVGQHDALFDGQQKLAPVPPAAFGVHGEGFHAQSGGAATRLGQDSILVVAAFGEQTTSRQPDTAKDHRDGEFVGDVLEVVADGDAGAVAPLQKMQVVEFSDRRGHDYIVDLRRYRAYMFATMGRAAVLRCAG
jgi:hypothetical protein